MSKVETHAAVTQRPAWTREQRAWLVVAVVLALIGGLWATRLMNVAPDTGQVIAGSDAIVNCVRAGTFHRCGTNGEGNASFVGPFPPLQHLPDIAFKAVGISAVNRVVGLSLLSMLAFAATLALGWRTLERLRLGGWWPAFLLVLVTSPLLYYGNATWGEMLAAFLLVGLVSSALLQAHWGVILIAAFGATVTKENAFPFVLALGLTALLLTRPPGAPIRGRLVSLGLGTVSGVVLSALLNVFRFGSPFNEYYLQEKFRAPDLGQAAEFFGSLLIAPNAGVLLFWTSACVLLGASVVAAFMGRRGRWRPLLPALVIVGVAFFVLASLATWWMPYGWHAWGPRLVVPWIPALVLLAIAAYGNQLAGPLVRALRSNVALVVAAILLLAPALPHLGQALGYTTLLPEFFVIDERCPPITPELLETAEGRDQYYECTRHRAWKQGPILLDAANVLWSVPGVLYAAALAALVGSLLWLTRASFSRDHPRETRPRAPA